MAEYGKKTTAIAAFLGAITIAIGAFGAHGLDNLVDPDTIDSFNTGVRYQMYHVIVLLLLGVWSGLPKKILRQVSWAFYLGILLFSGSIYLLALDEALGTDLSALGPVTPVGGLLLIGGWIRLGVGLLTMRLG